MIDHRTRWTHPGDAAETRRETTARSAVLGRQLRNMYREVAQEPIPQEFKKLLQQLDESDES